MVRPKDAVVWNEELVEALRAREDHCRQTGKARQHLWRDGARAIESVRKDIYTFRNGRIVNFPTKLSKTVDALCRGIIAGSQPKYPPGYVPSQLNEGAAAVGGNPYSNDPYLKRIKIRGGAFAILVAFHLSDKSVMTKDQIIRAAQPFCDEEMRENYFGGRARGAWSGVNTLEKHGLITVNKTVSFNERAGGLRSHGPWTYSLTKNGEQFVEAMIESKPAVFEMIAGSGATRQVLQARTEGSLALPYPIGASTPRKLGGNSANDEEELRSWAKTASIGDQKEFNVSKARRSYLHDVCDEIDRTLTGTGRSIVHHSAGTGRHRTLMVRIVAGNETFGISGLLASPALSDFNLPIVGSQAMVTPVFSGAGRKLEKFEGTPPKRARVVPASIAAANAAMERQAIHESKMFAEKTTKQVNMKSAKKLFADPETIDLIAQDNELDKKQPARSVGTKADFVVDLVDTPRTTLKQSVLALLESDDEDDSLLTSPLAVKAHQKPIKEDVIDLCQSQESVAIVTPGPTSNVDQLRIYIDNRERNRNHTPRTLRMELTRIVESGPISLTWPTWLKKASVREQELATGDFCFNLVEAGAPRFLPTIVERKRVGDLVQRSFRKDHWFQLHKLLDAARDYPGGVCVFVIEGDFRTAVQYTAYGAQEVETYSPLLHTIDDEDSLLMFIGRAILTSEAIRFVQSRDEQGSLRAVGALGLMSAATDKARSELPSAKHVPKSKPMNGTAARTALNDRLQTRGIPWKLARRISEELGSEGAMDRLYNSIEDEDCRNRLLTPLLVDLCHDEEDVSGSASAWSETVHKAFYSTLEDPLSAVVTLKHYHHLLEDPAEFIGCLHCGLSGEAALDVALSSSNSKVATPARMVFIELPAELESSFQREFGTNSKAFDIKVSYAFTELSTVTMQTKAGEYESSRLFVFVIEGDSLIARLDAVKDLDGDFVDKARQVSKKLSKDCFRSKDIMLGTDRVVVLVRGLQAALDLRAKGPKYRPETNALLDMVLADLMVSQGVVVLQAIRKTNDCEKIIRQLAMACFHFQLLRVRNEKHVDL